MAWIPPDNAFPLPCGPREEYLSPTAGCQACGAFQEVRLSKTSLNLEKGPEVPPPKTAFFGDQILLEKALFRDQITPCSHRPGIVGWPHGQANAKVMPQHGRLFARP